MYSFLTKFSTNCYPGTRDSNLSLLALCFGFPSISQSSFFSYFFQLISLRYEYEAERMGISWPMLFFSLQKWESFSCLQVTGKNTFPWLGSGTNWWYIIFSETMRKHTLVWLCILLLRLHFQLFTVLSSTPKGFH